MKPFDRIPVHEANVEQGAEGISPKVTGSTIGGALATLLWTLLAAYLPGVQSSLHEAGLTAVTGATGTIFAAVLGYLIADPVRTASNPH
jgi:hypothetical protein